jgi:DNA-binding PadR family transcriptional regulator
MHSARPNLEYALLGLIAGNPSSGYDLRKIFQDTPMAVYSDSPGSIYPALRRLQTRGLIAAQRKPGVRRRRTLSITAAGRADLIRWLAKPLTLDEVARGTDGAELRLAFMSDHLGSKALSPFFTRFADLLEEHADRVTAVQKAIADQLTASATLALELGIATITARAAWCRRAARRTQEA